jgi:hypothetical protein
MVATQAIFGALCFSLYLGVVWSTGAVDLSAWASFIAATPVMVAAMWQWLWPDPPPDPAKIDGRILATTKTTDGAIRCRGSITGPDKGKFHYRLAKEHDGMIAFVEGELTLDESGDWSHPVFGNGERTVVVGLYAVTDSAQNKIQRWLNRGGRDGCGACPPPKWKGIRKLHQTTARFE